MPSILFLTFFGIKHKGITTRHSRMLAVAFLQCNAFQTQPSFGMASSVASIILYHIRKYRKYILDTLLFHHLINSFGYHRVSGGIWTHYLRIMSEVFYHSATPAGIDPHSLPFQYFWKLVISFFNKRKKKNFFWNFKKIFLFVLNLIFPSEFDWKEEMK